MPNLKQDQLQKLEQRLRDRQGVLTEEVRTKREETSSTSPEDQMGGVGDPGDESVTRMQTDLDLEEAGRDLDEMRDIDGALQRIANGSYGTCDDCGGDIDARRLEAQPTATRCIACQTQHEKTYATKSTPTL